VGEALEEDVGDALQLPQPFPDLRLHPPGRRLFKAPTLREAIERRAQSEGLSFNKTVIRMLEEGVGTRQSQGRNLHHDLDHLAGTWSGEEAEEFEAALADQRQIDVELWE
jgi:hypothetical protein